MRAGFEDPNTATVTPAVEDATVPAKEIKDVEASAAAAAAVENSDPNAPGSTFEQVNVMHSEAVVKAAASEEVPHGEAREIVAIEAAAMHSKFENEHKTGILSLITDVPAPNLLLGEIKKREVPEAIKAAIDVAHKEGYVVREMTEHERVMAHYQDLAAGSIYQKLMIPLKMLSYGIYGPDGKERVVRAHGAETDEIKTLHAVAHKYDDRAELVFRQLQMMTSVIASFSHGSNDVANAMGPFSTILGVYNCDIVKTGANAGACLGQCLPNAPGVTTCKVASAANGWETPDWILAWGGISIGIGFIVYGYHLMRSLGNNLTYHSPSRGYAMEMGAAITVLLASRIGLPISTTQCITGATMAIGMMNGLNGVNWRRFASIFGSWVVTMPLVGIYSGLLFAFIAGSPSFRNPSA